MSSYTYIDNILGVPIPDYALKQLNARSSKTLGKRDNDSLVYVANKSGWVRVVSSVDISGSLGAEFSTYRGSEMAKANVLFGGVSAYKSQGNSFGYDIQPYYSSDPTRARKSQFDSAYGFRPMPGITSAKISTQGRLGSVMISEIDFKVNTKEQLDMADILYFKIGYFMLVEWGNTFFFKHSGEELKLDRSEAYSIDPFENNLDKEKIRTKIANSIRETEGNYGAMFGIVTNYSFTINTDGGYDCKIKVMGPGMLAESMRVNGVSSLPEVYLKAIDKLANTLTTINRTRAEKERDARIAQEQIAAQDPNKADNYPLCVRNLIGKTLEIKTFANGVVGVTGKGGSGPFKDYQFYLNYKYSKTGTSGTKSYSCDIATNRILNEEKTLFPGQGLTTKELIEGIKKKTLPPKWELSNVYESSEAKSVIGYRVYENQDNKSYFYDLKKETLILLQNSGTDYTGNSLKLSVDANSLHLFLDNDPSANLSNVLRQREAKSFGNFRLKDYSPSYDTQFIGENLTTLYEAEYSYLIGGTSTTYDFNIRYNNTYGKVKNVENTVETKNEKENRQAIEDAIFNYINNKNNSYTINRFTVAATRGSIFRLIEAEAKAKVTANIWVNKEVVDPTAASNITQVKQNVDVPFNIFFNDVNLISQYIPNAQSLTGFIDPVTQQQQTAQASATQQAAEQPLQYTTASVSELQASERSMYKSQLEAILRVVQITTISDNISDLGVINEVKKIEWTEDTKAAPYATRLYNGILIDGAMRGLQKSFIEWAVKNTPTEDQKKAYIEGSIDKIDRYKLNLYYGFHKSLMKTPTRDLFNKLDSDNYRVNFKELLTSYVIPYYQSKNLIEGGDIHYPTYIPLGFFFIMLNHCSFLYDTSDSAINLPMFYLDFNPESNVMLSSDFMLSANPYKFVVPFTGDINSYKKLFDDGVVKNNVVGSGENSSPIWKEDAVSSYIPSFKTSDGKGNYRGKTMNALVSIDYLLDVIKKHSTMDETNSVYFRPMMEEILSDLGKCLGGFNVFRLGYDDPSNCFFVVDDQTIPGDEAITPSLTTELPLYGSGSIAKSFVVTTEYSSKLGSSMFIGGNADVRNQTTLGIDGTSIGGLSLYAIDRYKKAATAANDNAALEKEAKEKQKDQRAIAASRFNQAIDSYYRGGLRSENMVDQAVNYYIEAVAKARNNDSDPNLRSTILLPLSVNFSTDGISAMAIYQSFTISDQLLPYSYKYGLGQTATRKVGFVITGLEHTIQNNTWTTDVKANMYYVKDQTQYGTKPGKQSTGAWRGIPTAVISPTNTGQTSQIVGYRTNFVASSDQRALDARRIAETYYGKPFIDNDWNCLIAAAYAESDYKDRAKQATWCAAVIINRARISGKNIYEELTKKNQFQAVTGTSANGNAPSGNYVNGPSIDIASAIYDGIIANLKESQISHRYTKFTSNLESAYGSGTNINYLYTLRSAAGSTIIGNTVFAYG